MSKPSVSRRAAAASISFLLGTSAAYGNETVAPVPPDLPAPSDALDATDLGEMRGGQEAPASTTIVQTAQNVSASLTDGRIEAETITTGSVTFEQNAITNFNGVGLFNTVTGANNAVNAVIGITINLH